ncbi:hypothetical protein K435DRAFT_843559 [Dendrothele bispora CBS 962.96]|uniref:ABC transporter domain-containing protein n=1 Tax=Dendrothele bispora (strain CBS 962.96) TaxID=1314807 RepID=A0A4S8L7R0_DENBC|nr:hypothetical protein K435DRAFT_843559 [Dendrothele bispora CBS 962.96]
MEGFFRALAAACKSESAAQTFACIVILVSPMYPGYFFTQPSMIDALSWISYTNYLSPNVALVLAALLWFEFVMTDDFRTLSGACDSLIPSGPGYKNINQVCTMVDGNPNVDGKGFVALSYEYSYSRTWRNFGILIAFAFGFIALCLLFTELNTRTSSSTSVVLFLRSKAKNALRPKSSSSSNEEKAQRVSTGVVTGDKFVNAPSASPISSHENCQQTDTHLGDQTPGRKLTFRDAAVGTLHVENRKRTTIGVELAVKPKRLLFLDEPTSRLDSQDAWAIMVFLRDLANNGQAILYTIHQPSAVLFQVFDRLLLLRKGGETVYCGDVGHNATTLIDYFEHNGSRRCNPSRADFMLDVIGAGATAKSIIGWYSLWVASQATALQTQIERIHGEGRKKKIVETTQHSEFAMPWIHQLWELFKRDMQSHYRNPTYLMSRFVLSIFAGFFIEFSFFKSKNTQQGTQNKFFSIFMSTIISVPLANQLQVIYINVVRSVNAQVVLLLVEIPWNIIGSSFLFCWYWTVGYPSSRDGIHLSHGVNFPVYYTTIGQAAASMSPNAEIAALLCSSIFSFVIAFNGVVEPFRQLGWRKWMYRVLGQVSPNSSLISEIWLVTLITTYEEVYTLLKAAQSQILS